MPVCRDVHVCASTHANFLGYRGPRSARKHRDGSLSVSRFAQRCMLPRNSQLRSAASMTGPFRLPRHLQTRSVSPLSSHTPPSPCLATWMRCHACACCTTGKGTVCHVWPQQDALARLQDAQCFALSSTSSRLPSWRVSSTSCLQTDVEVFEFSTLGASVVLPHPVVSSAYEA